MAAATLPQDWTYVGRRELTGGGLGFTWLDDNGETRIFKTGAARAIGGVYVVHATADRTQIVTKGANAPTFARVGDDPRIPTWEAEDVVAYGADQLRRAEAKAKRDDRFGELTLDQVRTQMVGATAPGRAALVARVLREIGV